MRVLVIEDDTLSAFLMEELLATFGLEAELARSAQDGIEILRAAPEAFDLVLMDIHMPGMTGDDAARILRGASAQELRAIPIVAVTADPVWADPKRRAEAGLSDYLPKPVNVDALNALCQRFGV